jgi:hypothetical protein
MATKQVCFMCYRRHRRARERAADNPYTDLSTSPISKDGRRVLSSYNGLLKAVADLRLSPDAVREVIDIVRPYLKPAAPWLAAAAAAVSSEGESDEASSDEDVERPARAPRHLLTTGVTS